MKVKRLLPLLLAILLMLTSCGATTKEVELTVDNVSEYLDFRPYFTEVLVNNYDENSMGEYRHQTDFSFECYSVRGGGWFNNVEITVEITFDDWCFAGEAEKEKIVSTFKLPANGLYKSDEYRGGCYVVYTGPGNLLSMKKVKSFKVVSVSGTFEKGTQTEKE